VITPAELHRRWFYLAGLYVWVVAVVALVCLYHGGRYESVSIDSGGATATSSGSTTLLQSDRGPAVVIIVGLLTVVAIASLSFMHRVRRDHPGRTIVGVTMAVLVTASATLGLMSVGVVLIPVAVLLWLIAAPFRAGSAPGPVRVLSRESPMI
jgi:hypothetical protein